MGLARRCAPGTRTAISLLFSVCYLLAAINRRSRLTSSWAVKRNTEASSHGHRVPHRTAACHRPPSADRGGRRRHLDRAMAAHSAAPTSSAAMPAIRAGSTKSGKRRASPAVVPERWRNSATASRVSTCASIQARIRSHGAASRSITPLSRHIGACCSCNDLKN